MMFVSCIPVQQEWFCPLSSDHGHGRQHGHPSVNHLHQSLATGDYQQVWLTENNVHRAGQDMERQGVRWVSSSRQFSFGQHGASQ